jgi:hypothetical protein
MMDLFYFLIVAPQSCDASLSDDGACRQGPCKNGTGWRIGNAGLANSPFHFDTTVGFSDWAVLLL